jgi:hypothetical protein
MIIKIVKVLLYVKEKYNILINNLFQFLLMKKKILIKIVQ